MNAPFDGSTGHSKYNMKLDSSNECTDESIFATTLIPLQIFSNEIGNLWTNTSPSSPRFCRPIRIEFAKESKDLILQTKKAVEKEIEDLENLVLDIEGRKIFITARFHMTLIDGKVLSIITGNFF